MNFEVEQVDTVTRKLRIEVPPERVSVEFDRTYRALGQRARIKGFRPGRIPRPVLERFFAAEAREQVASALVQEALGGALADAKLEPVARPEVSLEDLADRAAFRFTATIEIRPSIETLDTSGLEALRPSTAVSDEDVDATLEQIRLRYGELVPIESRTDVARGDFATVSVAASVEGAPLPGMSAEAATVEVAGGRLPPEVDERLALARVGEAFQVDVTAPEDAAPEIAGKVVSYAVVVKSIAERRLPTLDDEFAKDHGDCETLAQLRERVREQLEAESKRRAHRSLREDLLGKVLEKNPVPLPPSLVAGRTEDLIRDFKMELMGRGLQFTTPEHETEAREKLRPRAERDVHVAIVLDELAAREGIAPGDDEVAEHIGRVLATAGTHRDQLRQHFEHEHARESVRAEIRREKALQRLVELAEVKEGTTTP